MISQNCSTESFSHTSKCCVVGYSFGENYQDYIPLYIYSILKHYPRCDVRIYVKEGLLPHVAENLKLLREMGHFEIIENYYLEGLSERALKNSLIQKSIRWLIYEEDFYKYDALYIGDIDIFICRDSKDLFEQHFQHCDYLGLPYSNIVRPGNFPDEITAKTFLIALKNYGPIAASRLLAPGYPQLYRMSGLHFIKPVPYYEKILPTFDAIKEELNKIAINKSRIFRQYPFTNETILYHMISLSGLSVPKQLPNNSKVSINTDNAQTESYRPLHGLHLGVFRIRRIKANYLQNGITQEYYKQFLNLMDNDKILRTLMDNSGPHLKSVIDNMQWSFSTYGQNGH